MNDRELLGLAAKAGGYEIIGWEMTCGVEVAVLADLSRWQPLLKNEATDCMGDALRLAVKLRINIEHMQTLGNIPFGVSCWPSGRGDCGANVDGDLTDYAAVTCRAIVLAAAEVGRSMP